MLSVDNAACSTVGRQAAAEQRTVRQRGGESEGAVCVQQTVVARQQNLEIIRQTVQ